jgi:hypothetical protein
MLTRFGILSRKCPHHTCTLSTYMALKCLEQASGRSVHFAPLISIHIVPRFLGIPIDRDLEAMISTEKIRSYTASTFFSSRPFHSPQDPIQDSPRLIQSLPSQQN